MSFCRAVNAEKHGVEKTTLPRFQYIVFGRIEKLESDSLNSKKNENIKFCT